MTFQEAKAQGELYYDNQEALEFISKRTHLPKFIVKKFMNADMEYQLKRGLFINCKTLDDINDMMF